MRVRLIKSIEGRSEAGRQGEKLSFLRQNAAIDRFSRIKKRPNTLRPLAPTTLVCDTSSFICTARDHKKARVKVERRAVISYSR